MKIGNTDIKDLKLGTTQISEVRHGNDFVWSPFLLNEFSGAEAAYSLRKLRSAYTGPAVRVRRSSDDAEQDIGFSGIGLDESSLTTFVGANDGFVVTWYDQSSNARNLTQATAASQPKIVNAGSLVVESGKVALDFDGIDDSMENTALAAVYTGEDVPFSWFSVLKNDLLSGTVRSGYGLSNTGANVPINFVGILFNENILSDVRDDSGAASFVRGATFGTSRHLTSIVSSGTSRTSYIDSVAGTTTGYNLGVITFNKWNLGSLKRVTEDFYWNGRFQELVLYADNRQSIRSDIEESINNYWGVY